MVYLVNVSGQNGVFNSNCKTAVVGQKRKLEKHPDKIFIGRIKRGFDFLGNHFSTEGLTVAQKTIANFIKKGILALWAGAEDSFNRLSTWDICQAMEPVGDEWINDTANACRNGPCWTTPPSLGNHCINQFGVSSPPIVMIPSSLNFQEIYPGNTLYNGSIILSSSQYTPCTINYLSDMFYKTDHSWFYQPTVYNPRSYSNNNAWTPPSKSRDHGPRNSFGSPS